MTMHACASTAYTRLPFIRWQQWLSQAEELWRGQLHAFKAYAETVHRRRKTKT